MAANPIDDRSALGRAGEDAALAAYRRRGFTLLARNWRCPLGELDLVLERSGLIVFSEVKARRGVSFGGGYEAVTWTKRRKLRQLADAFLASQAPHAATTRFDVASVWMRGGRADVEVFEDAF